ncbi:AraC family transcriptional regulator ligand-binding domain-containing protein [Pseudomonas aeruginosa]|nr:AraC family transcriptional regulator ligand-binding domain-containing protein [Pseudomonas aeruginosa]MBN0161459.1 AraC family transcriptional regulator ligand-binding domain-containing protein [Pseudomonas aeruginosa]
MSHSVLVFARIAHILTRFMEAEGVACAPLQYKLNAATRAERIPIEQWWELLEQLAETSGDPLVGLRVGRHARLQDAGVLGYLAASCATLGEALQRMQHYQALLQNLSFVWLRADGPHCRRGITFHTEQSSTPAHTVLYET